MDPITEQVRSMYAEYPYPPQDVGLRMDGFPRLLLSYVERAPRVGRPLQVIDAGCGTGGSLLAMARANPSVQFVGADLNTVALEGLERAIARERLGNLQVLSVDLAEPPATLAPDGGFDVMLLSGVLHHLADPQKALCSLAKLLAPDGVMVFMLYGRFGRAPVLRIREALAMAFGRQRPLSERLELGRRVVSTLAEPAVCMPPWDDATMIADAEFVDRYLHVHEVSYSVQEAMALLDAADLRFVRWMEPLEWDLSQVVRDAELVAQMKTLPEETQYALVERLADRPSLVFVACGKNARLRSRPRREDLPNALVEWNPQAVIAFVRRSIDGKERLEAAHAQVRNQGPLALSPLQAALAAATATSREVEEVLEEVCAGGQCTRDEALGALEFLLDREVLFVP